MNGEKTDRIGWLRTFRTQKSRDPERVPAIEWYNLEMPREPGVQVTAGVGFLIRAA
jgi:hypothetical protein